MRGMGLLSLPVRYTRSKDPNDKQPQQSNNPKGPDDVAQSSQAQGNPPEFERQVCVQPLD